MRNCHLISVEGRFNLSQYGLVVSPTLSVPSSIIRAFQTEVTVERPDGQTLEAEASFNIRHWRLLDGSSKAVIAITFLDLSKEDVPIGSRILVDVQIAALWPDLENSQDKIQG